MKVISNHKAFIEQNYEKLNKEYSRLRYLFKEQEIEIQQLKF